MPRSADMSSTVKRNDYWFVPWLFVLGFVIVFAANGGLVYFAVRSAPGLVSDRAYDEGVNYNRVLARAAAEDALGWRAKVAFAAGAPVQNLTRPGTIKVTLRERGGAALSGAVVALRIERPLGPDDAMTLRLDEGQPGEYAAPLTLPQIGQWEVHVTARRAADAFEMTKRIEIR
jgi:nitrogen fixation protein FixH